MTVSETGKVKRNVWLITIGEPLPIEPGSRSLRCQNLAQTLAKRGCDVTWWTSDFNHFEKQYYPSGGQTEISVDGYRLRFLHGRPYTRNISIARQRNHNELARDFSKQAHGLPRPDVIVCSFPPIELALVASRFAATARIPFVLDIRDLWPDEMVARVPGWLKPIAAQGLSTLARKVGETARQATAILGVSQKYLTWGLQKAGREAGPFDQVIPLGYPDHADSKVMRKRRRASNHAAESKFELLFVGSLNQSVDLTTVLKALDQLPELDCRLTVCGTGEMEAEWRQLAANDSRIEFAGWVGASEIRNLAGKSHAGIVCYRRESLVGMPNKLFEYLSFGLPVINSLPGEAQALVEEFGIGWNYPAGSVEGLVTALKLASEAHGDGVLPCAAAGALFESRFESGQIYANYADLLDRLQVPS